MTEYVEKFQILKSLPSDLHWLCDTRNVPSTPDLKQVKSEHPQGENLTLRKECFCECLKLFAFNGDDATGYQDELAEAIGVQLSRCDICILGYYESRQSLVEKLKTEHDEEEVAELVRILNSRDIARIKRGLDRTTRVLRSAAPSSRHRNILDVSSQLSLFEALCCEGFLADEMCLRDHFQEPFQLVQTNRKLKITHYVPAATTFLFDPDPDRFNWATYNWSRYNMGPGENDFRFAIRDPLFKNVQSVFEFVPNMETLQRVWNGVGVIVSKLNNNLVTHSLRAMDVDIFRLALEHLKYDTEALRPLIRTIQKLLEIAPRDFWDAMGAISPTTFIEQIFNNPQYDRYMEETKECEEYDSSALKDMLAWIKPFMASLETSHQAQACRSLAFQLLDRLQAERFPSYAKIDCKRVGLATLAWTLSNCNKEGPSFTHTGRVVAAETLDIVNAYIKDIVNIAVPLDPEDPQEICSEACLKIMKTGLALQCKSLRTDQDALKQNKELPEGYASYSLAIWDAVVQSLDRGNVKMARAALVGVNDLTGLEKFNLNGDETYSKEKSAFNVKLGRLTHLVCQILERINDFKPSDLDTLYCNSDTATALVASLFSPDQNLYEAGVNLVKSISSESARKEAIGHLLKTFMETTLNAFSWALHRIARNRTFASCPRMLKTSKDVLDVLCDSQGGLLRIRRLSGLAETKAVEKFWEHQWESLQVIYETTENWGRAKVAEATVLKEFCRDTMQFSQHLFDQYTIFANAISCAPHIKQEEDNGGPLGGATAKDLLSHPAKISESMVKWLRLRDAFLIEVSVMLTTRVLNRLTELGMTLAEGPSKFLGQILNNRSQAKSNLQPQEKAELARALEANLGHPIKFEGLDADSDRPLSDRDQKPSAGSKKKTTAGIIDLDAWRSKARVTQKPIEVSDDEFEDSDLLDQDLVSVSHSAEPLKGMRASIAERDTKPQLPEKKAVTRDRKPSALQNREDRSAKVVKSSLPSEAERVLFREKREKERDAKKKRDAETLALVKKKAGLSGAAIGENSNLGALGIKGKDHAPKPQSMMVSSGSESNSDDDLDRELFGEAPKTARLPNGHRFYEPSQALQAQIPTRGPVKKTRQMRSAKDMRARLAPDLTSLHKTILSWEFFHNGDFPPGSERNDYSLVTNTFRTPMDYQSIFEPLLFLEAWQGFLKSKEEGNFKTIEIKVASRMNVDAFLEISTTMPMAEGKEMGISEADIVLISRSQSPSANAQHPHCLARVWKINRKKTNLEITYRANVGNSLVAAMIPNATLYAVKVLSVTPLEREYGALLGLKYFDLCEEIIRAKPSPLLDYSEKQLAPLVANYGINVAQAKAIKSAVDNDAFTLIQGPPGSGKTKTIVAIVGAILTGTFVDKGIPTPRPQINNTANQRLAAKKLLVCAPSNAAVDELVMRFKEGVKTADGLSKKLSVIRLGRSDAINANVIDVALEELVNAKLNLATNKKTAGGDDLHNIMTAHKATSEELNLLRAQVDALKASGKSVSSDQDRQFEVLRRRKQQLSNQIDATRDSGDTVAREMELSRRRVQQEILDDAHVICATLSGSGHDMFQGLNIEFETVIIDEAAQSIELSALIPLKYGCSKCILVGDPKQLPPTVLSREAARFQYEQSLFVRMQENHPNDVHLLDTQYRMHPEISVFPSNAFYDARLLDGPDMAKLRARPWHQSHILGPYRFFDVQGQHQSAPRGHSLINLAEIEVAINLYNRLVTDCKGYEFRGKVGIITPYKSQLRELRSRFAQRYGETVFANIEFNTTDAFQGRESEVIIFSCVRASSGKGIGFLSDIRRMNVGITRAKCSLWVLGNSHSLMQGEFWSRLVQDARSRDRYTSGDLSTILKKSSKIIYNAPSTATQESPSTLTSRSMTQDIEMTDAPTIDGSTSQGNIRKSVNTADPKENPAPNRGAYQPGGGVNGLNDKDTCHRCGDFTHRTHLCDNAGAGPQTRVHCFRCNGEGHTKSNCTADRCVSCGDFGHTQKTCSSTRVLSNKDKLRIGKQEAEHNIMVQRAPELHKKRQLGDHDKRVPMVLPTSKTPPRSNESNGNNVETQLIGQKRRRDSSPVGSAPRGPKVMEDPRRPRQPAQNGDRSQYATPQMTGHANVKNNFSHDKQGPASGLNAASAAAYGRQIENQRPTNGNIGAPIQPQPPPVKSREQPAHEANTTITKPIEGSRRPPPPPNMVRPSRKRKEADPFIRPKRRP